MNNKKRDFKIPFFYFCFMYLFYTSIINTTSPFYLNETESKHAVKVLRLTENAIINVTDGNGIIAEAKIIDANHKKCLVTVVKSNKIAKPNYHIHIAIAPTKSNDRYEWFIEKATELGIDEITPLICQNSERKVVKTQRLHKTALAAMKQSLSAYLPIINEPRLFDEFVNKVKTENKYIAHCFEHKQDQLAKCYKQNHNLLILIGPEGDFSPTEVTLALKKGFLPVTLGNKRLRTETAGVYACSIIHTKNAIQ